MKTLLEVVRAAMARTNKPQPISVFGNQDPLVQHFRHLLEELGQETVLRFNSQRLVIQTTFTTSGVEDQGPLSTVFGDEYASILAGTMYDPSTDLEISGIPSNFVSAAIRNLNVNGAYYSFEVVGDNLHIVPAPPAAQTFNVTIRTSNWVLHAGGASDTFLAADDDTFLLPDTLLIVGLRMKWLMEKGLPYAEQQRTFEGMLMNLISRSNNMGELRAGGMSEGARPHIVIQPGNWLT